ncbi:uncharacterized protein LOC120358698 [Solenopsis invicta]|uniref:uncharacterized protein LOC120358698 n=1 Tax=Solenopsis invicta TaxID=13686 RepID=UPI00193E2A37|nr:uncharacterized protein LOC120358698 [Solenopsis invicta]
MSSFGYYLRHVFSISTLLSLHLSDSNGWRIEHVHYSYIIVRKLLELKSSRLCVQAILEGRISNSSWLPKRSARTLLPSQIFFSRTTNSWWFFLRKRKIFTSPDYIEELTAGSSRQGQLDRDYSGPDQSHPINRWRSSPNKVGKMPWSSYSRMWRIRCEYIVNDTTTHRLPPKNFSLFVPPLNDKWSWPTIRHSFGDRPFLKALYFYSTGTLTILSYISNLIYSTLFLKLNNYIYSYTLMY